MRLDLSGLQERTRRVLKVKSEPGRKIYILRKNHIKLLIGIRAQEREIVQGSKEVTMKVERKTRSV